MPFAQHRIRLTRQALLKLELDRVFRAANAAFLGGVFPIVLLFETRMIHMFWQMFRPGMPPGSSLHTILIALLMPLGFLIVPIAALVPMPVGLQRVIARLFPDRPIKPGSIAVAKWSPILILVPFFAIELFGMLGISGVHRPTMSTLALAGGLITLGLFRRAGHRITCAQCAYPWARTPTCPECGRAYTDHRDLRMGTRTRSPARIAIGLACLAAGVALALI